MASLSTFQLQIRRFGRNRMAMLSVAVLVLIAAACFEGPFAFPFTEEDADFDFISAPVDCGSVHPFGTDDFGRDLLVRVLEGGRVGRGMLGLVEVLHGFPYVILVILHSLLLGGGNLALFAAIVFTLWLTPAVIVRAQAQSLAKREFIEAARAGGMTS